MLAKRLAALLVLIVSDASLMAVHPPWVHRNTTHPPCATGIPASRYQYGDRSRSEVEVSRTAVLLRRGTRVSDAVAARPRVVARSEYADDLIRRPTEQIDGIHLERRIDRTLQGSEYLSPELWRRLESGREGVPLSTGPSFGITGNDFDDGVTQKTFRDSFTAVVPAPQPKRQTVIDLYQLDQAGLQINHCEVSQVAIQLYDDGQWVLSLRADQNRRPEEDELAEYNPRLHVKRNKFVIRMRCLGAFQHPPMEGVPTTGKPVVVDLNPCSFWVENGQPRYVRHHGFDPLVHEHFDDVDRVEIEFFYH